MPITRGIVAIGLAMVCALSLMGLPHPQKNYLAERCRAGLLAASQWLFSQAIRYAKNEQKSRFLLTQNVKLALDNNPALARTYFDFAASQERIDVVEGELRPSVDLLAVEGRED